MATGKRVTRIVRSAEPSCPECGGRMRVVKPKWGGKQFNAFWGCRDYPDCRGSIDIDPDTGLPDLDEGEFRPSDFDDDED